MLSTFELKNALDLHKLIKSNVVEARYCNGRLQFYSELDGKRLTTFINSVDALESFSFYLDDFKKHVDIIEDGSVWLDTDALESSSKIILKHKDGSSLIKVYKPSGVVTPFQHDLLYEDCKDYERKGLRVNDIFLDAIEQVKHTILKKVDPAHSNTNIYGVYVDGFKVVAASSHRCSIKTLEYIETPQGSSYKQFIPMDALKFIDKASKLYSVDDIYISSDTQDVIVTLEMNNGTCYEYREKYDSFFPDYMMLLEDRTETDYIALDVPLLNKQLKKALKLVNKDKVVCLHSDGYKLSLQVKQGEDICTLYLGDSRTSDCFDVNLNCSYLLDLIKALPKDTDLLMYTHDNFGLVPVLFESIENNFKEIIMPIRV